MEAEPQLLPVVYTLDYSNRSYMISSPLSLSLWERFSSILHQMQPSLPSSPPKKVHSTRSNNHEANTFIFLFVIFTY